MVRGSGFKEHLLIKKFKQDMNGTILLGKSL